MRISVILLVAMTFWGVVLTAAEPSAVEQRESVPYVVRGGLPNFYAKLRSGAGVKIAYFGGSITAQTGWRVQSQEQLQKQFPNSPITAIDAAIGGTGSNLGVFRLEADVLKHKPDLIFIEFAVNDSGAPTVSIRRSMEGIVRQTWKSLPNTDICFVYTITAANDSLGAFKQGKLPRSASVMEAIADHYAIPTVNFGYEIARLDNEGKILMKNAKKLETRVSGDELNVESEIPVGEDGKIPFATDGVHPFPNTGHRIYTKSLMLALNEIAKVGSPAPHKLQEPLQSDCWENVVAIPLDTTGIVLSGSYTQLPASDPVVKSFIKRLPSLWRFEPGASIEFKFKGTNAILYDLLGPDSSEIEITVDGVTTRSRRMDGYCTYRRLATCPLGRQLSDAEHSVKIVVLPDKFDKREVLFERNRGKYDQNPALYEPFYYYAGKLFLVGELVK